MKYLCIVLAACIMGGILLSGKATINFNHTPQFNKLLQHNYYRYDYSGGTLNVYLTDSIRDRDGYLSLVQLINSNKDKSLNLYLAGNGGRVNSALHLWFTLKNHPSRVNVIVTSNVYSAHAFLAFAGNTLKVLDENIVFLFHTAGVKSGGNVATPYEYCNTLEGTDRGIPRKEKCLKLSNTLYKQRMHTLMSSVWVVMDADQLDAFFKGHDVTLTGKEIIERLKK